MTAKLGSQTISSYEGFQKGQKVHEISCPIPSIAALTCSGDRRDSKTFLLYYTDPLSARTWQYRDRHLVTERPDGSDNEDCFSRSSSPVKLNFPSSAQVVIAPADNCCCASSCLKTILTSQAITACDRRYGATLGSVLLRTKRIRV